jgi:hypothetical protein
MDVVAIMDGVDGEDLNIIGIAGDRVARHRMQIPGRPELRNIAGYELEKILWRGAFGARYSCKDTTDMVKVRNGTMQREIDVLKEMQGGPVLRMLNNGCEGRWAFYVVEGAVDLYTKRRYDSQWVVPPSLYKQVFEAVLALGVLLDGRAHCDITPKSLYLVDGFIKIGDFESVASIGTRVTALKEKPCFGTFGYTPPEACVLKEGKVTASTDLFMAAATVYDLVARETITNAKWADQGVMFTTALGPPPSAITESLAPGVVLGDVDDDIAGCVAAFEEVMDGFKLKSVVLACLKWLPEERATAQQVRDMLDEV